MVDDNTFDEIINDRPEPEKGMEFRFFPEGYRQKIFVIWYEGGKPSATKLSKLIPPWEYNGKTPGIPALKRWIDNVFVEQARSLDAQVTQELNKKLVEEKIEMLQRHADTGKDIQNIAFTYIKDHKDQLTINSAARLWIAGVDVERASRGIPDALRKLNEMSDEDLKKQVEQILQEGAVELLPSGEDETIIDEEFKDE